MHCSHFKGNINTKFFLVEFQAAQHLPAESRRHERVLRLLPRRRPELARCPGGNVIQLFRP
jgi:hypothetical protein